MLFLNEIKVLCVLVKNSKKQELYSNEIPKLSQQKINEVMQSLELKGCIKDVSASIDYSCYSFELTAKGRYYGEYVLQ